MREQGAVKAPGANLPNDDETVYCSERCLRTSLFEAAGNMQLIVDQQREIDRLKERARWSRDDEDRHDQDVVELRNLLNRIIDQAEPIAGLDPKATKPGTEDFERLQIAANNILRLVGPHIRRRQHTPGT